MKPTIGTFRFTMMALRNIYPEWTIKDVDRAKALHYDIERHMMNEALTITQEDKAYCESALIHLAQAIDLCDDMVDRI